MTIFLAIVLGFLSITLHELGHYEAMRRCRIWVKEVSLLGIPLPLVPSLRWVRGETTWGLHPFILGAYVRPYTMRELEENSLQSSQETGEEEEDQLEEPNDQEEDQLEETDEKEDKEDQLETLNLRDQLYIFANGPLANVVYGLVLCAIACLIMALQWNEPEKAELALLLAVAATGLWWARRYVAYIIPFLTIAIFFVVITSLLSTSPQEALQQGTGGPVAVVKTLATAKAATHAFLLAAQISFGFALFNLLPLFPVDGGQMVRSILKAWCGKKVEMVYSIASIPLLIALIFYFLGLDLARIVQWIW